MGQLPVLRGEPEEPVAGRGGRLEQDVPIPTAAGLQQYACETICWRVQRHEGEFQRFDVFCWLHYSVTAKDKSPGLNDT